ncbi:MAG: hypothetical protein NTX27_18205 [Verrucomicrobia bacterium]|nr:hypothetical protein [Verrucomicrobiota bacterium]
MCNGLQSSCGTHGTVESLQDAAKATNPPQRPEWLRLPAPGQRCQHCGLSRSAINQLILPTPANGGRPQVVSYCLRQRGSRTGIRLVSYDSLKAYIESHREGVAAI